MVDVVDTLGRPVTNAQVWAENGVPNGLGCDRPRANLYPGKILVVCAESPSVTVHAQRNAGVANLGHAEVTSEIAPGAITPLTVTLPAIAKATGRVVSSSGKPLSGVALEPRTPSAGADDSSACGHGGPTGRTGAFAITCRASSGATFDVTTRSLSYVDRTLTVAVGTTDKKLGDIKLATAAKVKAKIIKSTGKKLTNGPCLRAYRKSGRSWLATAEKSSVSSSTETVGGLRAGTYRFLATECYPEWDNPSPSPTPAHERKWVAGGKSYKLRAGRTVTLPTTKLRPAYITTLSITDIEPPATSGGTVKIAVRVTASGTSAGPTGAFEFEVQHANGDDIADLPQVAELVEPRSTDRHGARSGHDRVIQGACLVHGHWSIP